MAVPFLGVLIILPAGFDIFSVSNFSVCYIIFQNIWNSTGRHCRKQFPLCEKSQAKINHSLVRPGLVHYCQTFAHDLVIHFVNIY